MRYRNDKENRAIKIKKAEAFCSGLVPTKVTFYIMLITATVLAYSLILKTKFKYFNKHLLFLYSFEIDFFTNISATA